MGLFDFLNPNSSKASMNIPEIMALTDIIQNSSDLATLIHIYNQKGDYDNPQVSYAFGVSFIIHGDKARAKKALLKGASYGLKFPCEFYDTPFIDAIGQCLMLLLTQFPLDFNDKVISETSLAYVYLSKCIENNGVNAWDSYRSRALLLKDHESPMVWQSIIMENLGLGILIEPFIVSDFYFASQASDSPHQNALASARRIHQGLEDITIGGKDADDYSLSEMAEFGKKRHYVLFKQLEEKYKKGELTNQKADNTFTFHKEYYHEGHLPIINSPYAKKAFKNPFLKFAMLTT